MDKSLVKIMYRLANGKRICLEVSIEVKDLLEQADRQIRSQRRQDRRYLKKEEYIDGLTDTTDVLPQEDFADLLDRIDSYEQLYTSIDVLSETQRLRLILYYFGGYTYRQIADMECVSLNAVACSVKSAIKCLRKLLSGLAR